VALVQEDQTDGGAHGLADPAESTELADMGALFEPPSAPPAAPLALYRRYRPDTFGDMIGQEHVTEPLQRALENNRVNHAYLFSGPRGCGKTTSARILARALNCELGPAAEPCGRCDSCVDLARGGPGSLDVIEIDAASHGGVDDARDLRERAFFAPVHSRYKIYIVDEAHMVTTAGFNALLKLVEEPPPHVKFIFATTEPDKVIGTIRSRTHHYPFRLVPPKVLGGYLAKLCQAEGVRVEPAVVPLVVRAGAGSVRDSLSVLDQLLGGAADTGVSYAQATALLGFTPDSLLDEIVDAFAAGDAAGVFACVDKVIEVGQDPRRFAEDLLRRLRDLLVVAAVPQALSSGLVDVAEDQGDRLLNQAASLGGGELTRAAEVLSVGLAEMRGTTAPRLHLELMCARVLLPGTDVDDRGVHARLDRLERRIGVSDLPAGSATAQPPQPAQLSAQPAQPAPVRPEPERPEPAEPEPAPTDTTPAAQPRTSAAAEPETPRPEAEPETPRAAAEPEAPRPDVEAPAATQPTQPDQPAQPDQPVPAAQTEPAPQSQLSVADIRRLWPQVLDAVKDRRRYTWILLSQNSQVIDLNANELVLGLSNAGARDSFVKGGSEDILVDALVQVIGANLRIALVVDPSTPGAGRTGGSASVRGSAPATDSARPRQAARAPQAAPPSSAPTVPLPHADDVPPPEEPWPDEPPPDLAEPERPQVEPESSGPSDPRPDRVAVIKGEIRPTRRASTPGAPDNRDVADGADRDDVEVDETLESHSELLARRLGAEVIDESVEP